MAFGKPLLAQGTLQSDIATSRVEIEQTRWVYLALTRMNAEMFFNVNFTKPSNKQKYFQLKIKALKESVNFV